MSPRRLIFLYLICFVLKTSLLSWFLIPRWETPDESGHFSYIAHIAEGNGVPVLGEARMESFYYDDIEFPMEDREVNWIAQHPPLYYALMAPVYVLTQWVGVDMVDTVHWLRLANVLIAACFLWCCYAVCREMSGINSFLALAAVACLGAVPMFSNMAAGINNSMFLALMLSLGLWQSLRYLKTDQVKSLYAACLFMGLACLTKYTAMPVVAAWGVLMAIQSGVWKAKSELLRYVIGGVVCSLPIAIWLLRNQFLIGEWFPLNSGVPNNQTIEISLLEYFHRYNVLERFYSGFWCQMGWIGIPGDGVATILSMPIGMKPFYYTLFVVIAGAAFWHTALGSKMKGGFAILQMGVLLLLSIAIIRIFAGGIAVSIQVGLIFWLASQFMLLAHVLMRNPGAPVLDVRIQLAAGVLILCLLVPLVSVSYDVTKEFGYLRAVQGRYFFPVAALILVSLVVPAMRVVRHWPYAVLLLPVCLQIAEAWLWLYHVPSFYVR